MADMVHFQHGSWNTLPDVIENGTIYVAKAADGKAYMYIDKDGEKLNITSPSSSFYTVCDTERSIDEKSISAEGFDLTEGAQITVRFTDGLNLQASTTFNINGSIVTVKYRDGATSSKNLAKNATYTFVYDGTSFQLIGDINEVNNGITMSPANDTDYHPLLIAAAQGPETLDSDAVKSMLAVTNPEKEITATINIGRLNAPGGFYAHGGSATDGNETRAIYNSTGIGMLGNFEGGSYSQWSIYPDTDGNLIFNGVGDNGNVAMSLNLIDETLYVSNASINYLSSYQVTQNGRRVPNLYYGTTKPTSDIGVNGDIYIMYS